MYLYSMQDYSYFLKVTLILLPSLYFPIFTLQAARVAEWLERRYKDMAILASPVRIPLWDMGAGLSDETV
jgi:hypothetical protein